MVSSAVVPKGPYSLSFYRVPLWPGSLPDVIKQQQQRTLGCVAPPIWDLLSASMVVLNVCSIQGHVVTHREGG